MKFSFKERLMLSTVMTGFAASMAATAPAAVAQEEGVDEIFVTGSRIARKDFTANSPVVTVGQEALDLSGVTNIENLLNSLPSVVPGLNGTSNNPGLGGQATVDLRGLGSARTLVLVNGRRLGPSDKSNTVDLNVIPSTLVERIEVVTGGASAVYGSDAMAGVVNFIMKDDFEGAEFGMSHGRSDYEDATERTYDVTIGGNFGDGRGNAVLYGQVFKRDGVLQGARPWSQVAGQDLGGDWGSSRRPAGSLENAALNGFATPARHYITLDGSGITTDGSIAGGSGGGYNFTPVNAMILPQKRTTLNGFANYDINDNVNAFMEFIYADIQSNVQLAATPLTTSSGIRVPFDNPFLNDRHFVGGVWDGFTMNATGVPGAGAIIAGRADPQAPIGIQRRMLEVGERMQFYDKKFSQYTVGFEGTIPDWPLFGGWNYEASYTKSKSDEYDRLENDLSIKRSQESLDGCLPGSSAGCVIIDFFGQGSITPEQANWLRLKSVIDHHSNSQETLNAFISGSVWELPAGDLQVAVGTEYRKDTMGFIPAEASRGDLIGFNGVNPASGEVDVKEGYIEAVIPILSGYEMAEYLGIEAGYRYSKYSSVGGVRSFKVGVEWQPVEDIRFRAMYQEATRAPNVFELFQSGDENFPVFTLDACNGAQTANDTISQICAWQLDLATNSPVSAGDQAIVDAFNQSDRQIAAFRFGNPDLFEESSETMTIGAVITPTFLPWGDLSVSIDYYDIQISDWIGYRGVATIHDGCFASATLAAAMLDSDCARIARQPNGDLRISNPQENVSNVKTTGVDLNAVYSFSMDEFGVDQIPGDFQISALVTYLDSYEFDGTEYKGITYGLSGTFPEWKTNIRTTFSLNDWQLSWQYERISEMDDYGYSAPYGYPLQEAMNYHNISARWFVSDQLEIIANIDNVADQEPQGTVAGYATGPNVDSSNYDVLGRFYRVGVRLKF